MFDSPAVQTGWKQARALRESEVRAFGVPDVDRWLQGGLRRDGLHEFYGAGGEDKGAAVAMALLLGGGQCTRETPLLWLRIADRRQRAAPYGPGLAAMGVDPDAIILTRLPDLPALLKAAADSVRHGAPGAVLLEIDGRAPQWDLTASRRLTLAAERTDTMVLVVRGDAQPGASAAHSRWQVASAASSPLPANAPGNPVFDMRLLRQRGGREGLHVQLEWDREQAVFRAPLSGGASALPAGGTADRRVSRAA
ncbi:ImuA family protein [Stakelama tenebrarum]|uniref:Protein ImuA n=1 Tax=Stakelama tenebrarum TaxID=2711215 RepID=A0A6G6Y3C4_9SPHN|nr:hypothetical protein [Sphingosinithalassobacter tenebrarum]QIG79400.1 hypothetical protein G5C33_06075 [Sphingosinithalassobacter tenebrarum]